MPFLGMSDDVFVILYCSRPIYSDQLSVPSPGGKRRSIQKTNYFVWWGEVEIVQVTVIPKADHKNGVQERYLWMFEPLLPTVL